MSDIPEIKLSFVEKICTLDEVKTTRKLCNLTIVKKVTICRVDPNIHTAAVSTTCVTC